jgi:hypothetical protein
MNLDTAYLFSPAEGAKQADSRIKNVGWSSNACADLFYSKETVEIIYHKIIELLQGVDPSGRPIIVPVKTINHVMNQVFDTYRPPTANIYSRYTMTSEVPMNYVQDMIDQVIEIITSDVKNNLAVERYNSSLTAWTTVLGDFNDKGLRAHPPIKVRAKNTNHRGMVSFMNY